MMEIEIEELNYLVPDFPVSALDVHRRSAAFDWKLMRLFIERPHDLQVKMMVWLKLQNEPVFMRTLEPLSADEEKRLTAQQLVRLNTLDFFHDLDKLDYKNRTKYLMNVNEALSMINPCLSIKFGLGVSLFSNFILNLGTERHQQFYHDVWNGKILSCLAVTEVAHGSDTKRMRTTAVYDPKTEEFVIHTPDFKAAKCWAGNLGKQCTHALLFAQLVTNGILHGLHAFIVPIRDPKTLIPYPRIIVGDMGEKAGLQGIDNGFVMFNHFRIPRKNLLNRTGDVNPDGSYETSFTDPQKMLGAVLESLSMGRIAIVQESIDNLSMAVVIATRYAAQRTQFSDNNGRELPIIDYQLHQWRLFPYIAASYALKFFIQSFTDNFLDCVALSRTDEADYKDMPQIVSGFHALVCSIKPYITWLCRDGLQECRECCGGFGYLKCSGISDRRSCHDARVTYEGDNNVLLQQTSNWLLRQLDNPENATNEFPLSSVLFLQNYSIILKMAWKGSEIQDVCSHRFVMNTYEWLMCWLLAETKSRREQFENLLEDKISARALSQVFRAHPLSLVFAEASRLSRNADNLLADNQGLALPEIKARFDFDRTYNILRAFWSRCEKSHSNLKPVLRYLFFLFSLWNLRKHASTLYQGGYCQGPELSTLINEAILELCLKLKGSVLALVDALAPPDFVLNSVIGCSDGKLYERLMEMFVTPISTERPPWWKDMVLRANL